MYKPIWVGNVRKMLAERNISVSQAARMIGTSKQYLSAILAETEPQSTKEVIMDRLCMLLHANPGQLYTPPERAALPLEDEQSLALLHAEQASSAADLAILAERHFLAQDYAGCHAVVGKLLNEYAFELSPAATAQILLLAGKCCCLQGKSSDAKQFLREALNLFQKRLSAQPEKYLPLCMDTYRYLGLSEYAAEEYDQAIKAYQRVVSLAERYPELSSEMSAKVENAASGMLRAATKLGKLSVVQEAVTDIERLSIRHKLYKLSCRAKIELEFCNHITKMGGRRPTPVVIDNDCVDDPLAALENGLLLWGSGRSYDLLSFSTHVQSQENGEMAFVGLWLITLLNLSDYADTSLSLKRLESLKQPSWPSIYGGVLLALRAAWLHLAGEQVESFYVWQDALFLLKQNREFPCYIFCLQWFITMARSYLSKGDISVFESMLEEVLGSFTK